MSDEPQLPRDLVEHSREVLLNAAGVPAELYRGTVRVHQEFTTFLERNGLANRNGDILPFPVPYEHLQDANGGFIVPTTISSALELVETFGTDNARYRDHISAAMRAFTPEESDLILNFTEHLFAMARPTLNDRLYNAQQMMLAVAHATGVQVRPMSTLSRSLGLR